MFTHRTRTHRMMALAILVLFVLVACAPQATPATEPTTAPPPAETPGTGGETPPVSHGGVVEDYESLVAALREHGVNVEPAGELEQPFFPVPGRALKLDGQDVQVFEFEDREAAESVVATIGPSGSEIGTAIVDWVAPPHFYHSGGLIVLYLGEDTSTLEALASVLGPQFAGQ